MWNISEVYTVFDWIFVHWDEFFETFLPDNLKKQISEALLGMHKLPAWSEKLEEWNIQQFTQVDESLYDLETNLMDVVKGLSLNSVYYWATHRHSAIVVKAGAIDIAWCDDQCSDNSTQSKGWISKLVALQSNQRTVYIVVSKGCVLLNYTSI